MDPMLQIGVDIIQRIVTDINDDECRHVSGYIVVLILDHILTRVLCRICISLYYLDFTLGFI
jgi:hypothetical protein